MSAWLAQLPVQIGLAPFVVALAVALAGYPLRLSGLAAGAGFLTAVYLTGNLHFQPLDTPRKLILVGAVVAPLLGALADLAFRPTRAAGIVLGALFGLAALWVYAAALGQRPTAYGAPIVLLVLWTVAWMISLDAEPVRAGAAGVGLGAGVAAAAILGGASPVGNYGIALGAACTGFLLLGMLSGGRAAAGTSFTLAAGVIGSLLLSSALLLGKVPWYSGAALALVPLAARLPLPERAGAFAQGLVALIYVSIVAGAAGAFAWLANPR
jgi:hypothetical protein